VTEQGAPTEPSVYAWPQSVRAGEVVALHASGPQAEATVEIARMGAERNVVWRGAFRLEPHLLPGDVVTAGCGWPAAMTIEVPTGWRSGYYEVIERITRNLLDRLSRGTE
jgi:hypothetical protein